MLRRDREYQEIMRDPNLEVVRHTANFIPYFGSVQTNPIMANVKVRQALAYAVPYAEIQQKVYFGQGRLIRSITPEIYPNYTPKFWVYKTDLAREKAQLTDAGDADGFGTNTEDDKA